MSRNAGFYRVCCSHCHHVFEWPAIEDGAYGQALLRGERGKAHRYVEVLDNPVWVAIGMALAQRQPEGHDLWWRVLAALADSVDGEQFQLRGVCPNCRASETSFELVVPKKNPERIARVDDATFVKFLDLTDIAQRERILEVALNLMNRPH